MESMQRKLYTVFGAVFSHKAAWWRLYLSRDPGSDCHLGSAAWLCNSFGQVTHACVTVPKQCNLVLA